MWAALHVMALIYAGAKAKAKAQTGHRIHDLAASYSTLPDSALEPSRVTGELGELVRSLLHPAPSKCHLKSPLNRNREEK